MKGIVKGLPRYTLSRGQVAVFDGEVRTQEGHGKFVSPPNAPVNRARSVWKELTNPQPVVRQVFCNGCISMSQDPVIEARSINLAFATNDGLFALSDVNLTINKGDFVGFIGPSGCGKTTFLRALAALEEPTSGTILVNGQTPDQARQSEHTGMFFSMLVYILGTGGNIKPPLEIMGYSKSEQLRRTDEVLRLVELEDFSKKYPWQLSGGMQQRASIARALAFDAELLLMDEPFGALDEIVRDHLNEQLLELWKRTNKTICFVTHSIPEAVFLSTKIVVMSPRPGRSLTSLKVHCQWTDHLK